MLRLVVLPVVKELVHTVVRSLEDEGETTAAGGITFEDTSGGTFQDSAGLTFEDT